MTADLLREAAALMRERTVAVAPGPWDVRRDADSGGLSVYGAGRHLADVSEWSKWLGNAQHIASWHPAVALAVADWLECEAATADDFMTENATTQQYAYLGPAFAVAASYLGRTA